jgi:hypothetical protein
MQANLEGKIRNGSGFTFFVRSINGIAAPMLRSIGATVTMQRDL